jgi:hypothetical protein
VVDHDGRNPVKVLAPEQVEFLLLLAFLGGRLLVQREGGVRARRREAVDVFHDNLVHLIQSSVVPQPVVQVV